MGVERETIMWNLGGETSLWELVRPVWGKDQSGGVGETSLCELGRYQFVGIGKTGLRVQERPFCGNWGTHQSVGVGETSLWEL